VRKQTMPFVFAKRFWELLFHAARLLAEQ